MLRYITAAVAQVALGKESCVYLRNLSAECGGHTHRDITRMCFAEAGIDIEFSGKDKYEKAVIIDIDDDRIEELGLDPDTFRFGETVVRINEELSPPTEPEPEETDIVALITELIASNILQLKVSSK